MTLNHRLLAIDEGRQRLSLIDTSDPGAGWTRDLADFPLARDMQRLEDGRALIGYERGYFEIDIHSGAVLDACERWSDVTSARRLDDGRTLLTGYNLDGEGGINVLTLAPGGALLGSARRAGDYVRLMRPTPEGGYLLCMNDHILETDSALNALRELRAPGFEHAWRAERCADGSTLVAAGYGAFMARFDRAGRLAHIFGGAVELGAEVAPFFYASFQQQANGHLLVANWQGHGPDNGGKGRQLLEFDPAGRLLGGWSDPERISSLQGILIL
ncbi:hypothetical protein [Duganella violaceipulchra]|uniref:Uncharacterized protein n=1 Tax=Duganella violaceipulchra TaxID=2849652 RepID=A0AA41H8E3_9BURK|nr:hypothetical protein [Duganella violaceicalia]MBV6319476.1 hypothetical protein [Duganella violaceicalia]MCP2006713.1 hypothetical protein [Duganella violaceicalia]